MSQNNTQPIANKPNGCVVLRSKSSPPNNALINQKLFSGSSINIIIIISKIIKLKSV